MLNINFKKFLIYFILLIILFLIDRFTKLYVLNIAENYGEVDLQINNFINLILIWNKGIGFGIFSFDSNFLYNILTTIIIIINLIIVYLVFISDKLRAIFYIIILGGSLGNLFDRIYYSAVPDFIDLNYKDFHWFIFNFADIFITIGIICLILKEFIDYKKKNEN